MTDWPRIGEVLEDDAVREMCEALMKAQRLLSLCDFTEPSDLADLEFIETTIAKAEAPHD